MFTKLIIFIKRLSNDKNENYFHLSHRFTYITVLWECPDADVIYFNQRVDNIYVDWRHTSNTLFCLLLCACVCVASQENKNKSTRDARKRIADLQQLWFTFGRDFGKPEGPTFTVCVQTVTPKCKHRRNVLPSCRSGRRWILCSEMDVLMLIVLINLKTKAKDSCNDAVEAGLSLIVHVETSSVHGLKGHLRPCHTVTL